MEVKMEKDLQEIKITLTEIKTDLKYHIKRTDELEKMVLPAHNAMVFIKYFSVVAAFCASVAIFWRN